MKRHSIIAVFLAVMMLFGSMGTTWASSTQQQIDDAKDKQEQNQSSLKETQKLIAALEAKKDKSEEYLNDLNAQLEKLKSELAKLQNDYDAKQAELEVLQAELTEAKEDEEKQYEAMKLRIQYMYENSISDGLGYLFSMNNISDFLNQAENISKMTEYDRDMLEVYVQTIALIEEKEQKVKEEQNAIVALQAECMDKQEAIGELIQATYNQIREYQANIAAQESAESKLIEQINRQQEEINVLLKKAKEEEAARILAEKKAAEEKAAKEAAAKAEAARIEAEKKAAAEKAAQEAAKKAEEERLKAEQAAKEAAKKAEEERLKAEQAAKDAAEKAEADRLAAEKAAQEAAKKAEEERLKAEQAAKDAAAKAEADRLAAEKAEKEKQEAAEKAEAEKEAAEKAEQEKAEQEKEEASKGKYLGKFKLTSYCACTKCCGAWSNGITASGTTATEGRTVAMAGVPFGTKLSINGKIYVVEDRGTAYGHVDVFMGSHAAALRFGVKYADVYLVE